VSCLVAGGSLLVGCTSQTKLRETELAELTQWLPGRYDNTAQVQADTQRGLHPPHEAVALAIVPIDAPRIAGIGDITRRVFYLQEMAANDPRRVMTQKVLSFEVTDSGIVEKVASLTEPQRWRDGHLDPDLFRGLVKEDLGPRCELTWSKTAGRFVGANGSKPCGGESHGSERPAKVEFRAELGADDFAMAEIEYDAGGRVLRGRADEPFYRFRKQGP